MSWLTWPEPTVKASSWLPGNAYLVGSGNHPSTAGPWEPAGFRPVRPACGARWSGPWMGRGWRRRPEPRRLARLRSCRNRPTRWRTTARLVGTEESDRAVTDRPALARHFSRNRCRAAAAANTRQQGGSSSRPTQRALPEMGCLTLWSSGSIIARDADFAAGFGPECPPG